jgi:hypothetical protein
MILGKDTGRHAMVLVGMRRVENEKKWQVLLQNWWPGMQLIELIEVSSETFASSGAKVHFALKEQTNIKKEIPTLFDKQAETFVEGRDNPEKVCPERQFLSAGTVHSSRLVANRRMVGRRKEGWDGDGDSIINAYCNLDLPVILYL